MAHAGIYIAAVCTTLLCLGVYGGMLWRLSQADERSHLLLAFLITLPLQPLAFYAIRLPLDSLLQVWLNKPSLNYQIATLWYAPLTEEPAKFIPGLLLLMRRRDATRPQIVRTALSIGLGFGIGELCLIAHIVAGSAGPIASMPFYQYGGFLGERFMVCLIHGAFTCIALVRWRDRFLHGAGAAILLHFSLNFPIFLSIYKVWGLSATTWQIILGIWVPLFFFASALVFTRLHFGNYHVGELIFGRATCPDCNTNYPRPLWGLNFGATRYERCPGCRKFHWVNWQSPR